MRRARSRSRRRDAPVPDRSGRWAGGSCRSGRQLRPLRRCWRCAGPIARRRCPGAGERGSRCVLAVGSAWVVPERRGVPIRHRGTERHWDAEQPRKRMGVREMQVDVAPVAIGPGARVDGTEERTWPSPRPGAALGIPARLRDGLRSFRGPPPARRRGPPAAVGRHGWRLLGRRPAHGADRGHGRRPWARASLRSWTIRTEPRPNTMIPPRRAAATSARPSGAPPEKPRKRPSSPAGSGR